MREILTNQLPDATKVTLRPASPDDATAIIAAVRSSAQDRSYVLMEIYGKDAAAQRTYIERLDRGHNLFLVATVNDQIVGILALLDSLLCSLPGPALSLGVHIVREWRGRGIGSALLRYALRWAAAHGFAAVAADLFTTNERSLHLFQKAGFREEACQRRAVRVGAGAISEVILVRRLPGGAARP
jgi:RimJ/RimL family protein N-acetyltransferase